MMRRFVFALSVSSAMCAPIFSVQAETLTDTVAQAIASHPQMKEGKASLEAADRNVSEQKSGYWPVIAVDGSGGRIRNNDDTTRGNTADGGGAASWKGQGTITLTQPLFTGFAVENRVESAKERYSAATNDLSGTAEDIALRAARAHLNLMRTRELLALATQYLSDIEGRRKNISLMVKEGAADEAELLQADEIATAARNTKLGYEESFRQAEADYLEVVGAPPAGQLEFGEKSWNSLIPPTLDEAISYASAKNARVLAAGDMVAAAASEADAERSSLMPHVNAELSYTKADQSDLVGGELADAAAMIRMGWSFSTGGAEFARIDRLRAQQKGAMAKRLSLLRTVEHDTRQKYTSMQIVDQQFALLSDREKASESILKNFLAQFEGGKQTNLQLIGAHSKVFEAKAARTDAYYRQLLSRFELLNVMGRLREAFGDVKHSVTNQKG